MELDDVIKPDNLGQDGQPEKKNKGERSTKQVATRNRLESLAELLKSDDTQFDASKHLPNMNDFPGSERTVKMIDYEEEDRICLQYAEETIDSIIWNYIKSQDLLTGDKLKSIRKQHVSKLAELQYLVRNSKRNMTMLQEGIDAGDMGKDMFTGVREYQVEMRTNIEHRSRHVDKCEKYWEEYSVRYGLENKEEEIMRKAEVKDETTVKTTIMSQSELNSAIEEKMKVEMEKLQLQLKEKNRRDSTED